MCVWVCLHTLLSVNLWEPLCAWTGEAVLTATRHRGTFKFISRKRREKFLLLELGRRKAETVGDA